MGGTSACRGGDGHQPFSGVLTEAADPGTDLIEHFLDSLEISETELALTATGYTVTGGTPVEVTADDGFHTAFTDLRDLGGGTYRVYYRRGKLHVDVGGRIVYKESSGGYESWGPEQLVVDTLAFDDRPSTVVSNGGVETLYWFIYSEGAVYQAYQMPVSGGTPELVYGYPLASNPDRQTVPSTVLSDGAIVLGYGGDPDVDPAAQMCVKVGASDVYWLPEPHYADESTVKLQEPGACLTGTGEILAIARTNSGGCLQLRSATGGTTWYGAERFPTTIWIDSPRLLRMSTGVIVCVGRRRDGTDYYLSLIWTADDGSTWSAPTDLLGPNAFDSYYCGVIEINSTTLLVSYYTAGGATINVIPVTIEVTP